MALLLILWPPEKQTSGINCPDLRQIKHGKTTVLLQLHKVLCRCWQEGAVPLDTRDFSVISLYKNKVEMNDCNNYTGMSLISIVGKVFAGVVLVRLRKMAERVYPESQCGFLAEMSTL